MRLKYLFENDKMNNKEFNFLEMHDFKFHIDELKGCNYSIVEYKIEGFNDKVAQKTSRINLIVVNELKPISVLINDSSEYFNKRLYPLVNDFERKLRELLYLIKAINNLESAESKIYNLENIEFGKLFDILFSDKDFIKACKTTINDKTWEFTKKEILESVSKLKENTLFDKLFNEENIPDFKNNFVAVRNYRNDVMHAHNINFEDYIKAKKLFEKINDQINNEINSLTNSKIEKTVIKYEDFDNSFEKVLEEENNMNIYSVSVNPAIVSKLVSEESMSPIIKAQMELAESMSPIIKAKMELAESMRPIIKAQMELAELKSPKIKAHMELEEIMKPQREAQKKLEEIMKPLRETQKKLEEIMKPQREAQKKLEEIMKPSLDI